MRQRAEIRARCDQPSLMRLRLRFSFGLCAFALTAFACQRTEPAPAKQPAPASAPMDLLHDDRIAVWMGGCAKDDPFLEDTSDAIGVLVSKLATGQIEPLRRAREELSAYDERAIPELRRLFDACYGEQFLGQRVQNVIEVLGLMRTDAGREMILLGLRHPQETVRKAAARALVQHARPEDFDTLLELMPLSGPESQGDFALALKASDRARLELQFIAWIEAKVSKSLVDLLAVHLCDTHDRTILARWKELLPQLDGKLRVFLQAGVAAQPDEGALSELRTWLQDTTKPSRRQLVAQALTKVGLARELEFLLVKTDNDEAMRKSAVEALAGAPLTDETRGVLRAALADPSAEVHDIALTALVSGGDASAIDTAVELLMGSSASHESALKALQEAVSRDPKLAERVLTTLIALYEGEAGSGLVDERTLVRSIGQVPLASAADFLMNLPLRDGPPIQGVRAHRWLAQAAGNTGSAGLARLRDRWTGESDPARRMDLVMAGTYERSDAARNFVVTVLESPRATPPELLQAADRLAQLGPMELAAPILKRTALRLNDKNVRPAFNCLLWVWYARSP